MGNNILLYSIVLVSFAQGANRVPSPLTLPPPAVKPPPTLRLPPILAAKPVLATRFSPSHASVNNLQPKSPAESNEERKKNKERAQRFNKLREPLLIMPAFWCATGNNTIFGSIDLSAAKFKLNQQNYTDDRCSYTVTDPMGSCLTIFEPKNNELVIGQTIAKTLHSMFDKLSDQDLNLIIRLGETALQNVQANKDNPFNVDLSPEDARIFECLSPFIRENLRNHYVIRYKILPQLQSSKKEAGASSPASHQLSSPARSSTS